LTLAFCSGLDTCPSRGRVVHNRPLAQSIRLVRHGPIRRNTKRRLRHDIDQSISDTRLGS
jgi:hypothetical protein